MTQGAGPTKIRISAGVAARNLIDRVEPSYPKLAKEAHVEGDVVLQCMISKTGDVTEIKAISGHPILIQSAVEAVKEWKYKPFLLNGEPIAVQTTVTVSFHL